MRVKVITHEQFDNVSRYHKIIWGTSSIRRDVVPTTNPICINTEKHKYLHYNDYRKKGYEVISYDEWFAITRFKPSKHLKKHKYGRL